MKLNKVGYNTQQSLLSLFAKHPNYLLGLFFTYYPLTNAQLVKFKSEVKWRYLSSNSLRDWDQAFIVEFADQLDWDSLSANPSLPWTISFLKAFPRRFKGFIKPIDTDLSVSRHWSNVRRGSLLR